MTNENIVNIIKSKFKEGLDKASIEFYLLENGYNESDIEDSFNSMWDNPFKEYKNSSNESCSNKRFKYVIISSILGLLCAGIFYVFGVLEDYKAKTNDRIRKNDLEEIKIALESYYMENYIYPNSLEEISEQSFTPYALPPKYSDPVTLEPYKYIPINEGMGYKLCANLEMPKNEEICINSGI